LIVAEIEPLQILQAGKRCWQLAQTVVAENA